MEQAQIYKMTDSVVAADVAQDEFARFADAMDLDVDESKMDADELKSFKELKDTTLRALRRGQLVIDDKGQPVYTPKSGTAITFYEPTGASFIALDSKKKDHDVAKMYALMADMTRQTEKLFALMPQRDLKVCRSIATLFLG